MDDLAAAEVTTCTTDDSGRETCVEEFWCEDGIPAKTLVGATAVVGGTEVATSGDMKSLVEEDPTEVVAGTLDVPFMKDAIAVTMAAAAVLLSETRGAVAWYGSETAAGPWPYEECVLTVDYRGEFE